MEIPYFKHHISVPSGLSLKRIREKMPLFLTTQRILRKYSVLSVLQSNLPTEEEQKSVRNFLRNRANLEPLH